MFDCSCSMLSVLGATRLQRNLRLRIRSSNFEKLPCEACQEHTPRELGRGLVGKQLERRLQRRQRALVNRLLHKGSTADPVGQCRTVKIVALAGVDLRLPVQWEVVGIFGDQDLGHRGVGRQCSRSIGSGRAPAPPRSRKPGRHIWANA